MVRLSKLADYALVVMSGMARSQGLPFRTARDLAMELRLPLPTVRKLMKVLSHRGLLVSQRGTKGGYGLAREPREISLAEIIGALEGPIALTECSTDVSGLCDLEACCSIKKNQQIISQAVLGVLQSLTLRDLIQPLMLTAVRDVRGKLVPTIRVGPGRIQ